MTAPAIQRMEALDRANEIRTQRAKLRQSIHSGETKVTELLKEPVPSWLRSEPIGRLLKSIPRLGEKRTAALLETVPLGYWRTVGNLTARERGMLILRLRERKRINA